MQKIGASKFKEQCLSLLEKVDIITKHGKPVAKLVSIEVQSSELIGKLKGKIKIKGDIMSTGLKWNAESWHPYPHTRLKNSKMVPMV